MKINLKKISLVVVILLFLGGLGCSINYYYFQDNAKTDFEVDSLFLRTSLVEGGTSVNLVNIRNLKNTNIPIKLELSGVSNIANLKENELNLEGLQDLNAEIFLQAEEGSAGVYVGEFKINSPRDEKILPIVIQVQTSEVAFKPDVSLFSDNLISGQILNAEIGIFDLVNIGKTDVEISYVIKDFLGGIIVSEKDELGIMGKQSFTRSINLPPSLEEGNYVFIVTIKHNGSLAVSSSIFSIVEKGTPEFIDTNLIYITFVFLFFFIAFLILFFYSMFSRDKILEELKKQYNSELRRQRENICGQRKVDLVKLDTKLEKREYEKEFKKVKSKRLAALKGIQVERVKVYKEIKRKGKKNELQKQVGRWKAQGYNTKVLERKYKAPSVNSIKNKIKEFKAKGYDTSVLNKHLKK